MSYILDALRKSETERRQGKVPDLGQQVQLIHRPRKKSVSPVVWVAGALILNAAVLAVIFWPDIGGRDSSQTQSEPESDNPAKVPPANIPATDEQATAKVVTDNVVPAGESITTDVPVKQAPGPEQALVESGMSEFAQPERERATIIVPSRPAASDSPVLSDSTPAGRVPHLVELPLSFQKSVPDLTFNSHIYSSDPSSRRVMINNNYLRRGDSFSGLVVENITEDGVILSKQGQQFRVGTVRDWVSPR
ncbi:hypothetical protein BKP64_04860 [Marinobacter salinus]|uniref:Type II secretion system protein GspB C-terminal domain-containing protein n=1 Tax=Marinobacter salinus TaxID=1874317 RepID=A0A1D9GJ96_9GAMM|nr:general secretion pathway protein GspB [Marinobacter salinus]AOY87555.1 hypothetical protein BKP64_04860 [Marinobacter salinus]